MEGWIKIHRKILNHWIFQDPDYLHAWLTILLYASHKPSEVLIKKHLYKIGPGQLLWSQSSLAKEIRWSRGKMTRFIDLLKDEKMIEVKTDSRTSIITICKWESYQQIQTAHRTSDGQHTEHQTDSTQYTNKNVKNDKNVKKGEEKSKFARPTVVEIENYFTELGLINGKSKVEASKFFDHFQSNGWKVGGKATMRDWKAAARNWQKRTTQFTLGVKEPEFSSPPLFSGK